MDRLWSPWRFSYISKAGSNSTCIFCEKAASSNDRENLVVFRGKLSYVLLNLFPYTSGHLMVAPYAHVPTLADASQEIVSELMLLTRTAESHLRSIYRPDGLNMGLNIGKSAGAGVAGHIHMHVVPRWTGDANFMTTIGETRVLPEELPKTYDKVKAAFDQIPLLP